MKTDVPLILAPMAGFTDAPFRVLCRKHGCTHTVTEMVSSVATVMGDKKTASLAYIPGEDEGCAVQLFGHEPKIIAEAAKIIARNTRCGAIDINMGCPVKKIVSNGDGCALMKTPSLCGEIVYETAKVMEAYGIPVTVKMRVGYDSEHINAVEVAQSVAKAGAGAITVHGRTREELYNPGIHPEVIKAVRDAVDKKIPVYANGDITSAEDARELLDYTGCDGLMIGREALGNPWIFSDIKAGLNNLSFVPPTVNERVETAVFLVEEIVRLHGEETGIREARGRSAHFIKGIRGSAQIRDRLNRAVTLKEFCDILGEITA